MRSTAGARSAIIRSLADWLWWAALVLLVGLAAMFCGRRLSGGFVEPLGGLPIVGVALTLMACTAGLRSKSDPLVLRTQYLVPGTEYDVGNVLRLLVPSLAAMTILAALTLPGTPALALASAWFLFTGGTLALMLRRGRLSFPRALDAKLARDAAEESISHNLHQQFTREQTAAGGETLHAIVRVPCEAGDRLAVAHVAFCPPMAKAPQLRAYALDDSGAETKITLAETYGARIEVRLPRLPAEGQAVLIEVIGEVIGEAKA